MTIGSEQLKKIKISGYKSIKECELKLERINVLIGSNGAGKSNFISAFALLQKILNKELQITVAQSGLHSIFYNGIKQTDRIYMEIFFGNNSYGFYLIPTDDNRLVFEKEFYGYDGKFSHDSTISNSIGKSESAWETGVLNRIDEYVRPILEKQNWRVYHFHDTGRTSKMKQEHNLSNNMMLMSDASNLAAFLYRLKNHYPKNYREIVAVVQLIAPYFKDFVLKPQEYNAEQIILRWQQKGCEDIFNASQFSDGTLRFICLATLLMQPSELQPETIILDEPELGLHPYAITVFSEMVRQASLHKQIIISTQSVELLNAFEPEDVVVVDRSAEGSVFRRLNRQELNDWLESDYALGDLWKKNLIGGRLSDAN